MKPEGLLYCDQSSALLSVGLRATTCDPLTKPVWSQAPHYLQLLTVAFSPLSSLHHPILNCKHSLLVSCSEPSWFPQAEIACFSVQILFPPTILTLNGRRTSSVLPFPSPMPETSWKLSQSKLFAGITDTATSNGVWWEMWNWISSESSKVGVPWKGRIQGGLRL